MTTLPVMNVARGEAAKRITSPIFQEGVGRPLPSRLNLVGRGCDALAHHVGFRRPRAHAQHAHIRRKLRGQRPRQADQSALGCTIGNASGVTQHRRIRSDIDDESFASPKERQQCLRQDPRRGHVDRHGFIPDRQAGIRDSGFPEDAATIDQDVETIDALGE
jgi:hypothetical protein